MSEPLRDSAPPANIYEGNGQLSVAVPVPGAHADHTHIRVSADRLLVEAVCKYTQESQHYLRRDWKVGLWRLDLQLPRTIDPSHAHATLNLGVLVVMAPIAEAPANAGERELAVSSA